MKVQPQSLVCCYRVAKTSIANNAKKGPENLAYPAGSKALSRIGFVFTDILFNSLFFNHLLDSPPPYIRARGACCKSIAFGFFALDDSRRKSDPRAGESVHRRPAFSSPLPPGEPRASPPPTIGYHCTMNSPEVKRKIVVGSAPGEASFSRSSDDGRRRACPPTGGPPLPVGSDSESATRRSSGPGGRLGGTCRRGRQRHDAVGRRD